MIDDQLTLEGKLVELLAERGWTITSAESCTGGLFSARIVDYPGASKVLCESFVTYSNEAKHDLLGVSEETLERYGAVSHQTAMEMAAGCAARAGAQAAVAITGIAGPTGAVPAHDGLEEKPIGLVYIGYYVDGNTDCERCIFRHDRRGNREEAVETAMKGLLARLQKAD